MQEWDTRSGSLLKGRTTSNAVCNRSVRSFPLSFQDCSLTYVSITKMRENCLSQFDAHWNCLERNNQVGGSLVNDKLVLVLIRNNRNITFAVNQNEHWMPACSRSWYCCTTTQWLLLTLHCRVWPKPFQEHRLVKSPYTKLRIQFLKLCRSKL